MVFIFDMDGVLLDSEPLYYTYLNNKFNEYGLQVSAEEYAGFVGLPTRKVWAYLEETKGLPVKIDAIMNREEEEVNAMFSHTDLKPIEGVWDLLETLKQNKVRMSVASSSARSTIGLIVEKLGFDEYFDFLLSGTQVQNGKPHPDVFLRSAELHDTDPGNCLVLEDSHNGVKAAKSAGMICIGFQNPGSGNQDLSAADLIIDGYGKSSIAKIMSLIPDK